MTYFLVHKFILPNLIEANFLTKLQATSTDLFTDLNSILAASGGGPHSDLVQGIVFTGIL